MSNRKSFHLRKLIILLLVLVQSCDRPPATDPIPVFEPTQTPAITNTTVVHPNQDLTAIESETPASTATPNPSSTPTRTPSPPPIITLMPEEVKKLVLDYVGDNRGCRLPCLWGYTPGLSRSEDVDAFILKLGKSTDPATNIFTRVYDDGGVTVLSFSEETMDIRIIFSVYSNQIVRRLTMILWSVFDDNGEVVEDLFGQPIFNRYMEYYTASRILERYGTPSQILIAAFEDEPDYPPAPWLPFSIVLIYNEQGFLAEYITPVEIAGEHYRGCPWNAHIGISTWSPDEERPLAEVVAGFGRGMNALNIEYFKPLEEATGMTVDEFYQMFKEAGNTQCIDTPRSLWSPP